MGFCVDWSPHMAKFFGMAVKGVALCVGGRRERGEFIISSKGLEGGGIYAVSRDLREGAGLRLDLAPDVAEAAISARLAAMKPGETLANRLRKLGLSATAVALVMEFGRDLPPLQAVKALPVRKIGMLGAGLMGAGIAYVTADAGVPVRLKDKDDAGLGRGFKQIAGILDAKVKRRRLSRRERDDKLSLVTGTTDYSGMKTAEVIVEAVFEDLKLKQATVREVEREAPGAIFASNTSSIPIGQIASGAVHPEKIVGMHFFSPVDKMPLLEIIRGPRTSAETVATTVALGKKMGKTVIVVNDGPGFYTSRVLAPYVNEATFILAEGAPVEEIDRALVDFGFPVGPLQLLDEVGIDVGAKVAHIMHAAFGDRMNPPPGFDKVVESGRHGRILRRSRTVSAGGEGDGERPVTRRSGATG